MLFLNSSQWMNGFPLLGDDITVWSRTKCIGTDYAVHRYPWAEDNGPQLGKNLGRMQADDAGLRSYFDQADALDRASIRGI